jgi:hypothetical protein
VRKSVTSKLRLRFGNFGRSTSLTSQLPINAVPGEWF